MNRTRLPTFALSACLSVGLAFCLAVVLAGCGSHSRSTADPVAPTPSSTGGIPAGFPLAQGLTADGDTTVSRPRRDVRGVSLQRACWADAWPGSATDHLVVQQVGPELSVTRELAVYADAATAAAVAERIRSGAQGCRRLPAASGAPAMVVSQLDHAGAPYVVATFAETPAGGQPGGSVFLFTRVGRALLAVEDSAEWTAASAPSDVRHLTRTQRGVVARLCLFTRAGC
jgi:hypothetical protein